LSLRSIPRCFPNLGLALLLVGSLHRPWPGSWARILAIFATYECFSQCLLCEKDALKNVAKILAQDPGRIPYVGAPSSTEGGGKRGNSYMQIETWLRGPVGQVPKYRVNKHKDSRDMTADIRPRTSDNSLTVSKQHTPEMRKQSTESAWSI
jgi:hypothetical protein